MNSLSVAGLELTHLIGRGTCGEVYRAIHTATGEVFALKVFHPSSISAYWIRVASEALMEMPLHPGIVGVASYQLQEPYPYQLSRWADSSTGEIEVPTTLEDLIVAQRQSDPWRAIYEICDSLAWLHKHNLVHANLRPTNILISERGVSSTLLTDVMQGWVSSGVRLHPSDHLLYLAPEQLLKPDSLADHGPQWDVYAFGVVAFRMLTGRFPRGQALVEQHESSDGEVAWEQITPAQMREVYQSEVMVNWPKDPTSVWGKRRQEILSTCLALHPQERWADMREVMREFERLESDYLLEDAKEKSEYEKILQHRRVKLFKVASVVLGVGLFGGAGFAWYWKERSEKLELQSKEAVMELKREVETRENQIGVVEAKLHEIAAAHRQVSENLQLSQQAVDQFLSQILQLPTGLGLQAEISHAQIDEALEFYERDRELRLKEPHMTPALARNYFNTAQLMIRKQQRNRAFEHLRLAESSLKGLIQEQPHSPELGDWTILLGRTFRWLGILKIDRSNPTQAFGYFKQAVECLQPLQSKDEKNRVLRYETAAAWYELGRRARLDTRDLESIEGLGKVQELLSGAILGESLNDQEVFLLAKSRLEQALVYKAQEKPDDAMKELFDALESLVILVEGSTPRNPEQALALAEAYMEFGEMVAGKLGTNDSRDAQIQANLLLMELATSHPNWVDTKLLLAHNLRAMAGLDRDQGNSAEAVKRQARAVELMAGLVESDEKSPSFLIEYARQLHQQGQLYLDLRRSKDANAAAQQAMGKLGGMEASALEEWDEIHRRDALVLMAELKSLEAAAYGISKQLKEQKTALLEAQELWLKLGETYPSFQPVAQGTAGVVERLKKLK